MNHSISKYVGLERNAGDGRKVHRTENVYKSDDASVEFRTGVTSYIQIVIIMFFCIMRFSRLGR
jgi:hypothetical protein